MLTFENPCDPSCTEHPHCVCGAQLEDDGPRELRCECGGSVLIGTEDRERAKVAQ